MAEILEKKKFSSYLTSDIVEVAVGTPCTTFRLHEGLLNTHSDYFRQALKPDSFIEGITKKVQLDDIEPDLFGFFVEWIYTQKLQGYESREDLHEIKLVTLSHVYVLGERLGCKKIQEHILRIMGSTQQNQPSIIHLSDMTICEMLEIVIAGLPGSIFDDALKRFVISQAKLNLTRLLNYEGFQRLIRREEGVNNEITQYLGKQQFMSGNARIYRAESLTESWPLCAAESRKRRRVLSGDSIKHET